MGFKKYDYGSASNISLPEGCIHCLKGAKMVLFITGVCDTGCFYCPISLEKKDKDVIFANERRIFDLEDIFEEAQAMDATGTGITGGDPLMVMPLTKEIISKLKDRFGKGHHIHLYTSSINFDKALSLYNAGLDEIRFHPPLGEWNDFDTTELKKIISIKGLDVGLEVPAIPGKEYDLEHLIEAVVEAGIKFININEFEFSESNWDMMEGRGYRIKDELSSCIDGSERIALKIMKKHKRYPIHFCSSTFKDGVQLRNRLIRRAENIAKPHHVVTDDGTILRGIVYTDDLESTMSILSKERSVPFDMMYADNERGCIEVAPWILEKIAKDLPYKCYITEEYSTFDRMEVERIPLNR